LLTPKGRAIRDDIIGIALERERRVDQPWSGDID
jgi:hypothetical protein